MSASLTHQQTLTHGTDTSVRIPSPATEKDGVHNNTKQGQLGGRGSPEAASSETEAEMRPSSIEATVD